MRQAIDLNYNWLFSRFAQEDIMKNFSDVAGFEVVDLPHNAIDVPYHNFDVTMMQGTFTYKKFINIDKNWKGKDLIVIFDGVAHIADVFINDEFVTTHRGGYTPFQANITDYVHYGEENIMTVVVDSHENVLVPPFGGAMDYLGYSGIYREVHLEVLNREHIIDIEIQTPNPIHENTVVLNINLSSDFGMLEINVSNPDLNVVTTKVKVQAATMQVKIDIGQKNLWDCDDPYLYTADVKLRQNEQVIDGLKKRFGFREALFKADGFYLNGKKIKLIGLNRHQSYPYVGYAMPQSMQNEDADILKNDLGCNIVRTSHYPQSIHFLNRCDEIGLLVMEEIPGWQHIGAEEWQELTLLAVREMIIRDRHHPSIVLWGVRINESPDHHELYTKTNALAHELDSTRPTGGVRYLSNSEFLEDVYTFNDFIHHGDNQALSPKKSITKTKHPYLVTEFNGHMYPTKRFDDEAHQLEHALRYVRILNATMNPKNKIAGSIGWCMNDYNTHPDFGSGDQICYHGVLDMFRIPKLAASVYASQQDLTPILSISSRMNMGDLPSGRIGPIYCFTNMESVKVVRNGETIGTFTPDRKQFPHLKHPPIIITDLIGDALIRNEHFTKHDSDITKKIIHEVEVRGANLTFGTKLKTLYIMKKYRLTYEEGVKLIYKYLSGWGHMRTLYRFEGIIGQEKIITRTLEEVKTTTLTTELSRKTMTLGATYDAMRIIVKKVNQHQELLPYCADAIDIKVTGAGSLIGPSKRTLVNGSLGFYIRTNNTKGVVTIEVDDGEQKCVEMVVVK